MSEEERFYYVVNEPGKGGIRIETASYTRRQAIAKYLRDQHHLSWELLAFLDDKGIDRMWHHHRSDRTFCVKITVDCIQGAKGNATNEAN